MRPDVPGRSKVFYQLNALVISQRCRSAVGLAQQAAE
jgi:hypothetical protein